ncbi:MAG: YihA family ribosome biogenesis GTP-binding protein [Alphaproteobacteria bacterium]|nr:YihA family ribosome biogenesis GTP-binding protein [Alphaproteobacteria bacterium]
MIKFVGAFEKVSDLPETQFTEYAFAGRSNVGKSSLINAIVGSPIARTSNTPGRTQTLNMFNIDDRISIIDLPGYGYARVSKVDAERWMIRFQQYITTRRQLKRLFILIDSRIGPRDSDLDLMNFCDMNGISYQVIYTKKDKRVREHDQLDIVCDAHPAMVADILETSAEKKYGIDKVRAIIGIK